MLQTNLLCAQSFRFKKERKRSISPLPSFRSIPASVVGIPVLRANICLARVTPSARFQEKDRPGIPVLDRLLLLVILVLLPHCFTTGHFSIGHGLTRTFFVFIPSSPRVQSLCWTIWRQTRRSPGKICEVHVQFLWTLKVSGSEYWTRSLRTNAASLLFLSV